MKYFIKTCEYLFKLEKGKRFFLLFLFALPIGVAIAAAMPQGSLINWLSDFNAATSFREAWSYNGNINILVSGLAVPITFVLILFFLSVMTTVISRSLRVGVFKAESVFRDCNESFIPVLQGAFGYIVTALLLKVLTDLPYRIGGDSRNSDGDRGGNYLRRIFHAVDFGDFVPSVHEL